MKKSSYVVVLVVIGVCLLLLKTPFQLLLPGWPAEAQLLFKKLVNGSLIILFGWWMLYYLALQKSPLLGFRHLHQGNRLWPVGLLLLIWLGFSAGRFHEVNVSGGFVLLILLTVLIKATAEEVIFRGVLLQWFIKTGHHPRKAILVSSLLFSLMHISNFFVHGDWVSVVSQLIFAFFMGLMLGSVNIMTGNFAICCLIHTLVNIPAGLMQLGVWETVVTDPSEGPVSLAEGILSIIVFSLVFSPVILVALYYYRKRVPVEGFTTGL